MKLTIDNQVVDIKEGKTVLHVADELGIYIPHLCSHPELTPYGGCRLCCIEIEGMRGYPTACTTMAEEGMVIRTQTKTLQEMRREILQLILSEHPAACLVCEEDCSQFMETIRKVGVTTGCRWCSKDKDCELQKVVERLGVKEIEFPVWYREIPVETSDPFFDRDYNLCIYCGRCVRICQEHRKSSIISLKQRGRLTTIGAAFDKSHVEADCEFCGACLSVCPTGAISEKNKKWSGVPDAYHHSYCPLCSMNCQIQVLTKNGQIVGTLPPGDPHQSGGELCVKGRFCLAELVNHPDRACEPRYRFPEGEAIISWEEAIRKFKEKLQGIDGNRVAVYLSPYLTLEEIAAAREFCLKVVGTPYITSSALAGHILPLLTLAEQSIPWQEIEKAGVIVSIFLDGNYNYAPLTLAIKRAVEKGVPYFQVGWKHDTTSRFASARIVPQPGEEISIFQEMIQILVNKKKPGKTSKIKELLKAIRHTGKSSPVFIIGPTITGLTEGHLILQQIEVIVKETNSQVFVPNPYGNLNGLLSMVSTRTNEEVKQLIREGKIDLLYLIGDGPFAKRPEVDFIIHQAAFLPPDELLADLILPAATWGEVSGSYAGMNMVTNNGPKIAAITMPPGIAWQHAEIFARIAALTLSRFVPDKFEPEVPPGGKTTIKLRKTVVPNRLFPYLLIQEKSPHIYQNSALSDTVAGMRVIFPLDTLIINPADASRLGVNDGEAVTIRSSESEKTYSVQSRRAISPGYVYLATSDEVFPFDFNPIAVCIKKNLDPIEERTCLK